MNIINYWSSAGLFFDIIGVLLLFTYGLPSKIEDEPYRSVGDATDEIRDKRLRKNKRIWVWSHVGLFLIIIGFILQFIGTNTPTI